jgi:hypothetical protein
MTDREANGGDEPEAISPEVGDAGPPWMRRRRRRRLVRRVGGHVETRASYGILTLSTFGFTAAALLIVIALVGALVYLAQGRLLHAVAFFFVTVGFAIVAFAVGFGAGFVGLPFAGDWFLEWPSHVIAWVLGLAGCAMLAALVFLTPLPAYAGVLLTLAAVFGAGYTIAYTLRTTKPIPVRQGGRDRKH